MATNVVRGDPDRVLFKNGGTAYTSGRLAKMGGTSGLVCLLLGDVAANGTVVALIRGEVEYARETGTSTAWAQGDKLYYDATNNRLTKTLTSNTYAGIAAAATVDGDVKGKILLNVALGA